jgi:uncharacterized membrane protein YphA (DoxX/SURF4 family)
MRDRHPTARNRGSSSSTRERALAATRWAAAIVFVVFGAGKFVDHASELASFRHYGLPLPDVFVYAIGVLELAGGLLLAAGLLVRLAAIALAADMVGAIIVSGIGRGESVSLTLAPALLVAMVIVLWFELHSSGGRAAFGRAKQKRPPRALGGRFS